METHPHFAALEMAPTLGMGELKKAYFAALARHPPHADAVGFQKLRAAYEALQKPGALAAAYLASPVDTAALVERYEARFAAPIALAKEAARAQTGQERAGQRLVSVYSVLGLADALERAGRTQP